MRYLFVALLVLAIVAPAHAMRGVAPPGGEPTFDRHRIGFSLGGGYGKVAIGEGGVFGDTYSTPDDFEVGMGVGMEYAYRMTTQTSIEGFLSIWSGTLNGETEDASWNETWTASVLGGAMRYRPTGEGFYLRAGFGAAFVLASLDDPESEESAADHTDLGFGGVGSIGYDFAIAGDFTAGPRLEAFALDVGGGVTATALNAMFTFTW